MMTIETAITRHSIRVNNLRHLVAPLGQSDLTRDDMRRLLGIGETCLRDYLYEMGALLEIIEQGYNKPRNYRLTGTQEQVADFLAAIDAPRPHVRRVVRDALSLALRNPSRHIHVMGDDAPYPVKVHRTAVKADPWAFPRAFFRVGEGVRA